MKNSNTAKEGKCRYYGKIHTLNKVQCPAHAKKCSNCDKNNHCNAMCKINKIVQPLEKVQAVYNVENRVNDIQITSCRRKKQ